MIQGNLCREPHPANLYVPATQLMVAALRPTGLHASGLICPIVAAGLPIRAYAWRRLQRR
jgi:hypothetical protein